MEFGRASKVDCPGIGICKFHLQIFKLEVNYNYTKGASLSSWPNGTFSINEKENTFTMTFTEQEITQKSPDKLAELKTSKTFYIDEDIPFPANANESLQWDRKTAIVLKKGVYDIKYQNGYYVITGAL